MPNENNGVEGRSKKVGTVARRSTGRLEDGRGQGLSIPGKEGATKAASVLQEGIERLAK